MHSHKQLNMNILTHILTRFDSISTWHLSNNWSAGRHILAHTQNEVKEKEEDPLLSETGEIACA